MISLALRSLRHHRSAFAATFVKRSRTRWTGGYPTILTFCRTAMAAG